ncbi:MAG: DUF1624 domain-containing protein [Ignavibacteriales bacterium]|nr:DUF1624 domain-containing protein [Ignavibacteriales bacterium]
MSSQQSSRFLFVDLFRGFAVFVMMETHVVNAILLPHLKQEIFYKSLTILFNGLVAPSFLFCAGFALAISLERKREQFLSFSPTLWKYVQRLLFILGVAYFLHLPTFGFSQLLSLTDEQRLISFFQSDILHVIALTLILLTVLAVTVRNKKIFYGVISALTIAVIFLSPIIRELDYSQSGMWWRPYMTLKFKSQFPLFPWSAFLMCGTIVGYFFLRAKENGTENRFIRNLIFFALGVILVSLVIEFLPFSVYPNRNYWNASPEFFFVRLGIVLLYCVSWWYVEQRMVPSHLQGIISGKLNSKAFTSIFTTLGQESFLVYVLHLYVVYGSFFSGWSFVSFFGSTQNFISCCLITLLLTAVMYIMAVVWHSLKFRYSKIARITQYALVTIITLFFITQ